MAAEGRDVGGGNEEPESFRLCNLPCLVTL